MVPGLQQVFHLIFVAELGLGMILHVEGWEMAEIATCGSWMKLDSCHLALKNTHFSAEDVFLTVAIPGTLGPFLHPIRLKIEQFGIQPQQALLLG